MTEPTTAPVPPLETVWHIEATYAPDAAEARVPFRARHVARIQALKAAGVIVEAGAFTDVSASVLLIRAASEAEALEVCRQDVYMQNGVWVELRARPFGRVRSAGEAEPQGS
ncbi:MAG: YciI family protein [Chloroflexota bacterium]